MGSHEIILHVHGITLAIAFLQVSYVYGVASAIALLQVSYVHGIPSAIAFLFMGSHRL
jgi:hypothetical protein